MRYSVCLRLICCVLALAAGAVGTHASVIAIPASHRYAEEVRLVQSTTEVGGTFCNDTESWGLLAEASATGVVQASYGWSPQTNSSTAPLYARVPDNGAGATAGAMRYVYYHNDNLGTPQRITDKSGTVVWAADYDAFGRATVKVAATNALTSNLRFPGQYFDAETGLHYNDRRYFDPDTGRYTTRDPIGFEGGINLYAYAAHSPTNFIDPTGELIPLACVASNFGRCMVTCMGMSSLEELAFNCGDMDWGGMAKDCAMDCLISMIPIPNPCGLFGKIFGIGLGIAGGLMNSFPADTLVHTRVLTDSGYQKVLKPIQDIQVGDEVLAWDEVKAWDLAHGGSGAAGGSATAAPMYASLQAQSVSSANTESASSYQKVSNLATSFAHLHRYPAA